MIRKVDRPDALLVILLMGLWGTIGIVGILRLMEMKADPAQITIMSTIVSGIVGNLSGMLANTMKQQSGPIPTTITNSPSNPVPTTDTDEADDTPKGQKDKTNE